MGSRTRNRYRYNLAVWQRASRRMGIHIRIPISWSCKLYCNHSFIIRTSFTEISEFPKRLTKKRIYITHTIHKLSFCSHIILYISHALYVSLCKRTHLQRCSHTDCQSTTTPLSGLSAAISASCVDVRTRKMLLDEGWRKFMLILLLRLPSATLAVCATRGRGCARASWTINATNRQSASVGRRRPFGVGFVYVHTCDVGVCVC